ncbi:MAG: FHA domain-containing protein [Bacteroidetes bacterium]|nr:FHA domain-containing protein [Bacteroidota bacterium]
MTEKKRPTAKNILDGIVQAMIDAQEPLDDDLALVPANYEVYIHPRAYQELQSLMPRIKEQVRKRLDQELDRLNSRRSGGQGLFKRLFFPLTRLLFADRYFQQDVRPITYERSGETWYVDFSVTAEPDVEVDYLVVESDFGLQKQPKYKGRPTINIRRRTTMQPDGRFETVISAKRPRKGRVRERGARATYAPTPAVPSTDVLARLSYEDNSGRHLYYMRKAQIVVGRQDDPTPALDVALHTRPDVSREHLHIRHDTRSGEFAVKDLSQYGSTVDGRKLASSLNENNEDLNVWHPLPRTAEIGLADIIFIQFEAL